MMMVMMIMQMIYVDDDVNYDYGAHDDASNYATADEDVVNKDDAAADDNVNSYYADDEFNYDLRKLCHGCQKSYNLKKYFYLLPTTFIVHRHNWVKTAAVCANFNKSDKRR